MVVLESALTGNSLHVTAFLVGVFLHILVFRLGEWDAVPTDVVACFSGLYIASTTASVFYLPSGKDDPWSALTFVSAIFASLLAGLYTSLVVYRVLFHPLRRFPGPFLARLSSGYPTSLVLKRLHFFEETERLHAVYGDYVRTGPNELSIVNPKAVQAIHSNASKCSKGPWYNLQLPSVSLHSTRDRAEHAHRRKTWDQGFSSKALRDYEPRVIHYTNQLMTQIEMMKGKPMNVAEEFNLYSFDIMGNLAFGKDFNMVKTQKMHPAMHLLHSTTKLVGIISHLSWVFPLAQTIPGLTAEFHRFEKWLDQQVLERMENEPEVPDVFSWILKTYRSLQKPTRQDELNLRGDAMLIVVAGSDTTAASLTCLFLELAIHPEKYRTLQTEVDKYFSGTDAPDHVSLTKLPYLQACIDESLRMHPALPSGVQRKTPKQGLQIGETYIPGNSLVQIPLHTLYKDARVFTQPNDYIPERWTSRPELVRDNSVFAPFLIGRYSCVGKQLALMEIRHVASQIAHNYDIRLADDQNIEDFFDNVVDGFTLTCPKLDLVFTPRKK
ncbi:cytochrome P450 67 [Dactylonectria macrodidyma]|uniref:Cytochrome P450 67 n=1 Tax=Dactylonectria macrodidyma TaxID=307937 RepID=A0A9P9EQB7_9HYPO|nr:cytochrome P450 67 [Dactylonectria macrodidyma]